MKIIGLIQARDNSSRLPRKCTTDINGKVLIHHIWDRLQAVKGIGGAVVSTSVNSPEIVGWCKINDIPHFVGSEDDLLSRHLAAAVLNDADAILRVTGDELFIDPALLDETIRAFRLYKCDALINWHHGIRAVSEGLDCAIVPVSVMRKLGEEKNCPREDWLTYLDNNRRFKVSGGPFASISPNNGVDLHLSVDTPTDLARSRAMLEWLGSNDRYSYNETLQAYEATR